MKSLTKKIIVALLIALVLLPIVGSAPSSITHAQDASASAPSPSTTTGPDGSSGTTTVEKPKELSIGESLKNFVLGIIVAIQNVIIHLSEFAAFGVRWMIDFGTDVISFPVVTSGFEVTLSLINLLFVMGIIVIAFQIILQYHEHEAKSRLGHLILAALLVNFSLLIAGFLLDFSNIFTNFFIKDIHADTLTAAFNPQRFGRVVLGNDFWANIGGGLVTIMMSGIILITMLAIFIMATVRTVVVAGLLLLMPLTWGLWIFPGLSKHTSEWWESFMKYGVFYLPTISFFLWLAITTSVNTQFIASTKIESIPLFGKFFGSIIQTTLIIGIAVYGLKSAEALGGMGSGIGLSMAKKVGGAVGKGSLKYSGLNKLGRGVAGGTSKLLTTKAFVHLPFATTAANALAGLSHKKHDLEDRSKAEMGNFDKHQLFQVAANATTDDQKTMALMALSKMKDGIKEFAKDPANVAKLASMSNAYNKNTHEEAAKLDGIKDAIKDNPLQLAQALGGHDYDTTHFATPELAAVGYMRDNGIAKELGPGQISDEVTTEAIFNRKFLASLDSNASDTAVAKLKSKIEALSLATGGVDTATLKTQYAAVKQARDDVAAGLPGASAAFVAAMATFKASTSSDEAKALQYLEQSIRNEP